MPTLHIPRRRGGRQLRDIAPCKPKRSSSLTRFSSNNNDSCSSSITQQTYCLHSSWSSSISTIGDSLSSLQFDDDVSAIRSPTSKRNDDRKDSSDGSMKLSAATLLSSSSSLSSPLKKEQKKVRINCPLPNNMDQVLARMQQDPLSQLRSDSCSLHGSNSEHSLDYSAPSFGVEDDARRIEDYENICRQFEREF